MFFYCRETVDFIYDNKAFAADFSVQLDFRSVKGESCSEPSKVTSSIERRHSSRAIDSVRSSSNEEKDGEDDEDIEGLSEDVAYALRLQAKYDLEQQILDEALHSNRSRRLLVGVVVVLFWFSLSDLPHVQASSPTSTGPEGAAPQLDFSEFYNDEMVARQLQAQFDAEGTEGNHAIRSGVPPRRRRDASRV